MPLRNVRVFEDALFSTNIDSITSRIGTTAIYGVRSSTPASYRSLPSLLNARKHAVLPPPGALTIHVSLRRTVTVLDQNLMVSSTAWTELLSLVAWKLPNIMPVQRMKMVVRDSVEVLSRGPVLEPQDFLKQIINGQTTMVQRLPMAPDSP